MVLYFVQLFFWFLIWMFYAYWMHRLAHIPSPKNLLWKIHQKHHQVRYDMIENPVQWPHWSNYFLWFDTFLASLDVWITLTLPVVMLSIALPKYGIPLLILGYLYEVFLSESVLDHNPKINGRITRYFAWGQYHLKHHSYTQSNFAFYITLWDYVFNTVHKVDSVQFIDLRFGITLQYKESHKLVLS